MTTSKGGREMISEFVLWAVVGALLVLYGVIDSGKGGKAA